MWARAQFAVRRLTVDPAARLGSWRLSVVLMVVLALYHGFLAAWASSSPAHVVRNIATLLPFWLLYGLLLLNTGVCLWNRLPGLRRDLSRSPRRSARTPDWIVESPGADDRDAARALLRRLGYRVERSAGEPVRGVRFRWTALGTYLFHGAFFLVALGFLVTLLTRQEATVWAAVGERFEARPDQVLSLSEPRPLAAGVPSLVFDVDGIEAGFWRDQMLFTSLEADLRFPGGRTRTTRINRPLWVAPTAFLRLSGVGYTPRYELSDRYGAVVDSAFVKLDVFPPGRQDYFSFPDLPHRVYLQVLPDAVVDGGTPLSRTLDLVAPVAVVRIVRGRVDLGGGVLPEGEGYSFEGLTLRFPEVRYWGEFTIVRDPGAPVLFLGFGLGLIGLVLKLPGRRREIEWQPGTDGRPACLRGWGGPPPRAGR